MLNISENFEAFGQAHNITDRKMQVENPEARKSEVIVTTWAKY